MTPPLKSRRRRRDVLAERLEGQTVTRAERLGRGLDSRPLSAQKPASSSTATSDVAPLGRQRRMGPVPLGPLRLTAASFPPGSLGRRRSQARQVGRGRLEVRQQSATAALGNPRSAPYAGRGPNVYVGLLEGSSPAEARLCDGPAAAPADTYRRGREGPDQPDPPAVSRTPGGIRGGDLGRSDLSARRSSPWPANTMEEERSA
jgi:hypothetical protein